MFGDGGEEAGGVEADRRGDLQELDDVESSVAVLVLADEGRRAAQPGGDGRLGQAGPAAHAAEPLRDEGCIALVVDGPQDPFLAHRDGCRVRGHPIPPGAMRPIPGEVACLRRV